VRIVLFFVQWAHKGKFELVQLFALFSIVGCSVLFNALASKKVFGYFGAGGYLYDSFAFLFGRSAGSL